MKISGNFVVTASPHLTWRALMDPDTLCRLAASCEDARQIDATHYEGIVRANLALLTIRGHVLGEVLVQDEPRFLSLAVEGRSTGVPGTFHGQGWFELQAYGTETRGQYWFEVDLLGRLGTLGQPFFNLTGQRVATKFASKLSRHLAENHRTG